MKKIFMILMFLALSFNAMAQDCPKCKSPDISATDPDLKKLVNTFLRYSDEFILTDKQLMDSYIALNYCDEKEYLFKDEIARHDFRVELKNKILSEKDTYPHVYKVMYPIFIDEYYFDKEKIILSKESIFTDVSQIEMPSKYTENNKCFSQNDKLSKDFFVDLQGKINISEIPLPLEEARNIIPNLYYINKKQVFLMILTVDLSDVLFNNSSKIVFVGDVLDVGYYAGEGEETRFGYYDFVPDSEYKENLMKDLQFTVPEKTTY